MRFRPTSQMMNDGELIRVVRIFTELGFHKIRLTGGEPTIRSNIVELVEHIAALQGVDQVAMTTNGTMLGKLAEPLARAGLKRVNVSIDTLVPEKFNRITRWGSIDDVLQGIDAAEKAGLQVKLNAVVVRGYNDGEDVVELARLIEEREWQVRFIEMMPFGEVAEFAQKSVVTQEELMATIESSLGPLETVNGGELDGEARLFRLNGSKGRIGFISSVSQPFCAKCNRVRLTADGKLRLCLLRDREADLLSALRGGAGDGELRDIISRAIYRKPWGHGLSEDVIPINRNMSEIGG